MTGFDRPPWCACQPGCRRRATGIVAVARRFANACAEHGPQAADRMSGQYTTVPRWADHNERNTTP